MRTLSDSLKVAQQAESIDPLTKIVLTHGASSFTYTRDRILDINHTEEPFTQRAELLLDNSDGALTSLALKGFKGVISYGAITSAGEEYDACAPLWVIAQRFNSSPGKLDCLLSLIGIPNLIAEDKASESYMPDEDDTKTVKTLINQILGATMACYSHCQAYDVVWDSEDSLIDSYKPKDSFRIYVGGSRLAAVRRLLDYTKCVMLAKADGKLHIFQPVVSGATYDYEYSLESGHTFFSKAYRQRLVIPNYIVVKSQPDDDPQYSGYAKDTESYDLLPKRDFKQMRLESDSQADDIAEAILSKHQLWSEMGAADVPMNVGAEVFDYVKVTGEREDDYRIGNLGHLTRHYNAKKAEFRMTFSFGNWMNVKKALANIGITEVDEIQQYFTKLMVKDLYVENILAENMKFVWIDPDNTIDLSKIGDTLDGLPDGEVFARVKTLHLDAGQIKLDENILYKAGYDPSTKWTGEDLDDLPDGVTYQRVRSAALTAGGLVILDEVEVGTYGLVKSAYISAGRILLEEASGDLDDIDNGSTYEKVRKTEISAGYIKLTTDQDVEAQGIDIFAGDDHAIEIDANGITIQGQEIRFKDTLGNLSVYMGYYSSAVFMIDLPSDDYFWIDIPGSGSYIVLEAAFITLDASEIVFLEAALEQEVKGVNIMYDIVPYDDNTWLGRSDDKFARGYFKDLPSCPEGLPTQAKGLDIIKKIKTPHPDTKGKISFKDDDFPDELKIDVINKIVTKPVYRQEDRVKPDGKVTKKRVKLSPQKVDLIPTGQKEIEYIRTLGVLVQAVRELTDKVEALEEQINL